MCGITGITAFSEKGEAYKQHIKAATACIKERGPDGEGTCTHNNTALGHRRLSIIDTSDLAAQPFTDISGRYTIVFNGEIFNFKTLREQLKNKGVQFHSQSDTEVLLYLFISEREKCLTQLNGEFAFAVYDNHREELFLGRDRFGIKPLYYFSNEDCFAFASEIKALTAFGIPKKIDRAALHLYFHLNYIPSPYSIFENVLKLEAGHYMSVAKNGKIKKDCYYSIPHPEQHSTISYEAATAKLRSLLEHSVQQRMIADVPLGTFLSGGIDSSIITAIAAKHTKQLRTFSIGYKDEPLFDETHFAALVAKKHKTDHTVFRLSNDDLFADLHHVLDHLDEPFADSSALAVSILCRHTRKHVTVALSGDGADELFAGYNKHAAELKVRTGGFTSGLVKAAHPLLKQLPKSRNSKAGNKIRQLEKFAEGMKQDERERYWNWARWSGFTAGELFTTAFISGEDADEYNARKGRILKDLDEDYNSVLLTDMQLVLESDMLVKVDRMSMSRSLEVRVPFLDHAIVDFAFSLPAGYKIDGKRRKKILKDAFQDDLPAELLHRGKKGFEVPLLKWFRTGLRSMITEELLAEGFIREQNIFQPEAISALKKKLFSANPDDAVEKVWALIVFQYWWKKNMNEPTTNV